MRHSPNLKREKSKGNLTSNCLVFERSYGAHILYISPQFFSKFDTWGIYRICLNKFTIEFKYKLSKLYNNDIVTNLRGMKWLVNSNCNSFFSFWATIRVFIDLSKTSQFITCHLTKKYWRRGVKTGEAHRIHLTSIDHNIMVSFLIQSFQIFKLSRHPAKEEMKFKKKCLTIYN